jgi:hypothetical protein
LNDKNEFKDEEVLLKEKGIHPRPFLEYCSIKTAIPYKWKQLLKNDDNVVSNHTVGAINIEMGDDIVDLKTCNNKSLYWQILNKHNNSTPASKSYWMRTYDVNTDDMSLIYLIPFKAVRDTKIQSFQYKILNHIYACRLKLCHWRIKETDTCTYCDNPDNLEHHFYHCEQVSRFWRAIDRWWSEICQDCVIDNLKTVMLGVYDKDCHSNQINYIILKSKWYISRCKYLKEDVNLLEFLPELKKELLMERLISYKNGKIENFNKLWDEVMELF